MKIGNDLSAIGVKGHWSIQSEMDTIQNIEVGQGALIDNYVRAIR